MWKIDTTKDGIPVVFKNYQWEILKFLGAQTEPVGTGKVHDEMWINNVECSRASVINYLQLLAKEGIATQTEGTGKGGIRRLYVLAMTNEEIIKKMVNDTLKKLLTVFPKDEYLQFLNEEG